MEIIAATLSLYVSDILNQTRSYLGCLEVFGVEDILIKDNYDNSYRTTLYQLLNLPVVSKTCKRRIWWSPDGTKWHIDQKDRDNYMPYYFTESVIYSYSAK